MSHRVPLDSDLVALMVLGQRSKRKLFKVIASRLSIALVILLTGIKYTLFKGIGFHFQPSRQKHL